MHRYIKFQVFLFPLFKQNPETRRLFDFSGKLDVSFNLVASAPLGCFGFYHSHIKKYFTVIFMVNNLCLKEIGGFVNKLVIYILVTKTLVTKNYETELSGSKLSGYQIARLPNFRVTKLLDNQIVRLPNC